MEYKNQSVAENTDEQKQQKKNKRINILAFVGCLVLAFFIWVYVMNIKMTDNTKIFSISLDIREQKTLYERTEYSVFEGHDDMVKITVQGTKADLQKYSDKDFKAYVDVSSVDEAGVTPLNIVVESPSVLLTVVSIDPVIANVMIDETVRDKSISLVSLPKDLDQKIKLVTSQSTINVSGPKSYVDKIVVAKLFVNATESDIGAEYKTFVDVIFYDDKDNPVSSSYLTYDLEGIAVTVTEMTE